MNRNIILYPNSEFERQSELQKYVHTKLTHDQKDILRSCLSSDHNTIGLIGLLLDDTDDINLMRLLILASRKAKNEHTNKAREKLKTIDIKSLISQIKNKQKQNLSEVESTLLTELASCDLDHLYPAT
jgi:hypothetical protein